MEGPPPKPANAPDEAAHKRPSRRTVLLATLVSAAIVLAGFAVYLLARPPPTPLRISDGSAARLFAATFDVYTDTAHAIERSYSATTHANQSDGAVSVLTLRLDTWAFFVPGPNSGGFVQVDILPVVIGVFTSDLHLDALTVVCNQTGPSALSTWPAYGVPAGDNTSFDAGRGGMVSSGPNTQTLTPVLDNQSGEGPFYAFTFPAGAYFEDTGDMGLNAFVGVRATVTGSFAPAVSVGILLHIVDISIPLSGLFFATVQRSSGGTDWDMNFTAAFGPVNTTYLRILRLDGSVVVPMTAFASIDTSPYNQTITYTPVKAGQWYLGTGDQLALSAADYSEDYIVQFLVSPGGTPFVAYAATLG